MLGESVQAMTCRITCYIMLDPARPTVIADEECCSRELLQGHPKPSSDRTLDKTIYLLISLMSNTAGLPQDSGLSSHELQLNLGTAIKMTVCMWGSFAATQVSCRQTCQPMCNTGCVLMASMAEEAAGAE